MTVCVTDAPVARDVELVRLREGRSRHAGRGQLAELHVSVIPLGVQSGEDELNVPPDAVTVTTTPVTLFPPSLVTVSTQPVVLPVSGHGPGSQASAALTFCTVAACPVTTTPPRTTMIARAAVPPSTSKCRPLKYIPSSPLAVFRRAPVSACTSIDTCHRKVHGVTTSSRSPFRMAPWRWDETRRSSF